MTIFNGYMVAEGIDAQLNTKLNEKPITKENAMEYLKLARTIRTTCDIIEMLALAEYRK